MIYTLDQLMGRTKTEGGCKIWQGAKAGKGYGVVADDRERYVHRLVLLLTDPDYDPDLQTAHTCGKSDCVNPSHLYDATQAQNEGDKIRHGTDRRGIPGLSHCGKYLVPRLGRKSPRCKSAAGHEAPCKPDIFAATYEALV